MESTEKKFSLWKDDRCSLSLLHYLARMYGEKRDVAELMGPLRLGWNNHDELYQLYLVIEKFQEQPG